MLVCCGESSGRLSIEVDKLGTRGCIDWDWLRVVGKVYMYNTQA